MKNLLIAAISGAVISISCSSAQTSYKNRTEFLKLKGDWEITSINYDKNYKIKPFDEGADAQCWVGSQWKLIPNNWTGIYSINQGGDCPTTTQKIIFTNPDGFTIQFKKIIEGTKAKQNTSGYSLNLINQAENQFSLEQNIPSGGENVKIIYNFERTGIK